MSDLDEKLRKVLNDYADASYLESEENGPMPDLELYVAQIKQAFIDAHWTPPKEER